MEGIITRKGKVEANMFYGMVLKAETTKKKKEEIIIKLYFSIGMFIYQKS